MKKEGVIITQEQHPDIYKWLSENVGYYKKYQKHYTLTSEGKINAYCNVYLNNDITNFKYHFGVVTGVFSCYKCEDLISLKGSPNEVKGIFSCYGCYSLTSLIGSPETVGGYFSCSYCKSLTSLIGSPETVGGYFSCSYCKNLTSLIGSPNEVKGYFDCYGCKSLTSLIGFPKIINDDFYFTKNKFSNNPSDKKEYKLYLAMWLELLESVSNKERLEYITNYKDKVDGEYKKLIIPIEILKEYGF